MNRLRLAVCLDVPQRALMLVISCGGVASPPRTHEWMIRIGRTSTPVQNAATTRLAFGPVHDVSEGGA